MIKLIKFFNKKDWVKIILCLIFTIGGVWLELKMPDYMSEITKLVQTDGSKMKDILINGGFMLACAFGSLLFTVATGYLAATISSDYSMKIRKAIFDKVEEASMQEIKKFKPSSLITRTTNDVTQVEMLIGMGLHLLLKAPITAIWAVTKILNKNFQWSMITGAAVMTLLTIVFILMKIVIPKFKLIQSLTDKLNGITRENLKGIRVIRAFNAEKYEEDKFKKINDDLTDTLIFNQKKFALMMPSMYLVMHSVTLSIYFTGAYLIDNSLMVDKLNIFSDMVVFSSYSIQVIMSFLMLAMIFMILPRAEVSAKRINEVLDTQITIKPGNFNGKTKEIGTVEFKNVSFKYPDAEKYVIENISFKADKGETVAFIGSTGSGKSTLINLVPRFYDATEGEVLIDGINVKEYDTKTLMNKLGYIPQKAVMFEGSINYNVSYGEAKKKITDKKIKEAIKIAQAEEFVTKMEKTYETKIAQGGTNISGGQKQRLAIARAIARDPEIYIFDDSFSALDYKTDSTLRKELKKYTSNSTSLIVAQRIGTIMNADKIIVLNEGKCVGIGKHRELLKTCEVYRQIALSQLSKEELENA